jgi:hypothetical protein
MQFQTSVDKISGVPTLTHNADTIEAGERDIAVETETGTELSGGYGNNNHSDSNLEDKIKTEKDAAPDGMATGAEW